ncbi:hypothetical protein TRIATDRAFT_314457 [Trichoderma atroviride IMI 206040]|uniref:C2H2-type domain-containing protein n=3 Tax=Hypocrea atroviridis TaxID=63577 RepID=G9NG42_HYPAI|nr:uncharacterized protein TRIATDRAFT_314457 [Trichoderma atroviride IMI 206040]EHK50254.1 hypothetical protein TRIATDRAFT_314457 [Trichoderma atroviride IMI 206040]
MACPDSGSDDNIISLELVDKLGLEIEQVGSDEPRQFSIANGNIITALGQVSTSCIFVNGSLSEPSTLKCTFHVFRTLAVELIMGVEFLQETETLDKHKDRLVEEFVPAMQSLRVNSVGESKRGLMCQLGRFVGCATVDTGSDLDLVSPAFAKSRAYKIEPGVEKVEFADRSVGYTAGVINTSFVVGRMSASEFHPCGEAIDIDLFVLDNLTADIIIGQDTIEELEVFNLHNDSLIPSIPRLRESDINIIRHIGSIEKGATTIWKKIKDSFTNSTSDNQAVVASQNDIDQRENARREQARATIANSSVSDRERAQELENATTQAFHENMRLSQSVTNRLSRHYSASPPAAIAAVADCVSINGIARPQDGGYKCTFDGCTAAPFPTQYHLNLHANLHSYARPHFCPVQGCPRGKGGKGFKRKNELIRHGLAHDSPGYACPFCPGSELKYPRPDNLQRHVRVHHVDKNKDDPLLRDVLAQRPEGPVHGRRRRGP